MQDIQNLILRMESSDIISSMRLSLRTQILTLVLMGSFAVLSQPWKVIAAPNEPSPPPPLKSRTVQENEPGSPRPYELDSVELRDDRQVPHQVGSFGPSANEIHTHDLLPTRVVRSHSRSVLAGFWSGSIQDSPSSTAVGMSLDFQNTNSDETAQDYGLTVLATSYIGLHWDFQWNCCLGAHWEPYWGVGVGSLWSPSEGLGSFINLNRYQVRGRIGLEDLFHLGRRWKLESVLQWSPLGFSVSLVSGWTWDQREFWF
ncbi:MAG: hypothetical protein C5B49_02360 [Bdellovibrio sp.]|nr:MAG: hypothetical protein C5B49_02360 [Bdellovibrio sp.]